MFEAAVPWLFQDLRAGVIGAVGALVMFWLTGRRHVSQRWWDKRFEVYGEIAPLIMQVYHSVSALHLAVRATPRITSQDDLKEMYGAYQAARDRLRDLHSHSTLILSHAAEGVLADIVEWTDWEFPDWFALAADSPTPDTLKRLDDAGTAAVNLHTDFIVQARRDLGIPGWYREVWLWRMRTWKRRLAKR